MQQTSRKNKKVLRQRIIKLFVALCILIVLIGCGSAYYFYQSSKPLYISPLAKGFAVSSDATEKNINAIKEGLKKQKVEYESIEESSGNITVLLKDKSAIILTDKKNIELQLSSLQLILARLTMEGKLFTQLDMRFDKPVIKLK